jgi:acyl-CoA thioesterase II
MTDSVQILLRLLDLENIEMNLFRGNSRDIGGKSVFGGQVLAQALVAAQRTVEDRVAHSLHGYFLRPGDKEAAIVFDVDRIRDGKSFTTRRVVAIQHGRPIFNMAASFQVIEEGNEHQSKMPDVPPPEDIMPELEMRRLVADKIPEKFRDVFLQEQPIEFRPIDPVNPFMPDKRPPYRAIWFRADGKLPDDLATHQAILAYASDYGLLSASMLPHGLTFMQRNVQVASLDHALWFHRPFRADEWLLYSIDSDSASNARGFNRGSIFTRDGVLVASAVQEGLVRLRLEG